MLIDDGWLVSLNHTLKSDFNQHFVLFISGLFLGEPWMIGKPEMKIYGQLFHYPIIGRLPSGKRLHNYGKIHHF